MKAISICNPWAWYIVHGVKPVENRTWASNHVGPLLIQVSQKILQADRIEADRVAKQCGWAGSIPTMEELRTMCGKIVGQVTMTGCVQGHASPFAAAGQYQHVYTDAVLFRDWTTFPGKLGIFDVPEGRVPREARRAVAAEQTGGLCFEGFDLASRVDMRASDFALPSDPLQKGLRF